MPASVGTPAIHDIDPTGAEITQCPYEYYRALRSEAPVFKVPSGDFYIVSTYELLQEILKKPDVFQNDIRGDIVKTAELKAVYLPTPTLSQSDPPQHARHRRLVDRVLSPGRVAALEPHIQKLVDELIDSFIDKGRVELYREFAVPLPLTLMADLLGGDRRDLEAFKRWSTALVLPTQAVLSVEEERQMAVLAGEFNEYFLAIFRARRAAPKDDLISVLATASIDDQPDGRPLNDDEFISIIQQLLTGGNETSSSAICSSVLQLIRNPELPGALRANSPALEVFIEEMLRLESPIQGLWRRVKEDTTLGGVFLRAGSIVNIRMGAANRDEAKFAHAAELDLSRRNSSQHLGFGGGIHACVGRLLIKKELKLALSSIIDRLDDLRLADGAGLEYRRAFLERSLKALPITFKKRSAAHV
jgi:cytochrome P450